MEKQQNNLTQFFTQEYGSLKRYVRSRIRHTYESDAEDIIQDVALKLFSRPADALPIQNIGGFVYSAIAHRIIDVMRTKKLRADDDQLLERAWEEFSELFHSDGTLPYPKEVTEHLKMALAQLKAPYKDIIIALDIEGYSYAEISNETGIAQGTLMSRRHRAIGMLHKKLKTKIR